MQSSIEDLAIKGAAALNAARNLARLSTNTKNRGLLNIADRLSSRQNEILAANEEDQLNARRDGASKAMLDRLLLNPERLSVMAEDVRTIADLPDPIGETTDKRILANGLKVEKRRVPLGVIGTIYESRPNITIDISALCHKSGNSVILRGGKEAVRSNTILAGLAREAIAEAGGPTDSIVFIESTNRKLVGAMLAMRDTIDLMIPRGSADLINRVAREATMPTITGGIGVCHAFVDKAADVEMAVEIVHNSKVQRPTVCNALDTVLVQSQVAPQFLSKIGSKWSKAGVETRCDERAQKILESVPGLTVKNATRDDWGREYLSLVASVKVVDSLDEAINHIDTYGSGHSEVIVTEDSSAAGRFLDEVDSSVVLVNASTRFNDGGQFGLGAEVAISTNKLHARGPMGLRELTSYKWTVQGTGQIRT